MKGNDLFRRVRNIPLYVKHEVYNAHRSDEERNGSYRLIAIAELDKECCKEKNVYIEPAAIKGENPYHVLLKRSKDEIALTSSQCKYLSKNTKVVKSYDPKITEADVF